MQPESEPLLFLDIAHKNGRWQVLVKFAGQDLTLALDTEGDLFDPYAGTPSAQPQAIVRWTGSKFELEAVTSDGLHASGLVVAGGTRTGLGNGNTFKVSSLVASTHIERDTPAPASEGEARTIAIERGAQLKERLPIRKSPSSMGDSPAKVTLHFQSSGSMPGAAEPVVMRGGSVTLGRGDENDVLLLDPDRMVSKNHCVIEEHYGDVIVLDLSSNGTFLNYGEIPLGKKQTKLNSGDILSIGPYELLVEMPLVRADPIADPPQKKELLPAAWYRTLIREA